MKLGDKVSLRDGTVGTVIWRTRGSAAVRHVRVRVENPRPGCLRVRTVLVSSVSVIEEGRR